MADNNFWTSCNSCNECQACNKCQTCNICETYCQSSQKASSYIKTFQKFYSYEFDKDNNYKASCLNQGQTITIKASDWNNLISFIKQAYSLGTLGKTDKVPVLSSVQKAQVISHTDYNQVAQAFELGSKALNITVKENDIIYGTYFSQLQDYAINSFLLMPNQCNNKNQCHPDTECNACQACNSNCQACNNNNKSNCCNCNTCQKGNKTT